MRKNFIYAACLFSLVLTSANAETIETGFTSDNTAEQLVIKSIDSAKKQILMAAYSFTGKPIAQALINAKSRGVEVFAVLDKSNLTEKYSAATFLAHAKIPVRIDGNHAIMHNKYLIIDGITTETGSFNYTSSATNRNAENVMVIWNDKDIAKQYGKDWVVHWQHSSNFGG